MPSDFRDKLGTGSIGAITGMVLAAIINLGIFSTKADNEGVRRELAEYKAYAAQHYCMKIDFDNRLDRLEDKIQKLIDRNDRLLERIEPR